MSDEAPALVCASANPDKVAEIVAVLEGLVDIQPRPEGLADVIEDGDTLEDNARLKARAVCAASGAASLADDTGLEVDALGGAPGVHSARYAGPDASYEDNVDRLLVDLSDVPDGKRTARFRTVALVAYPDGFELVAAGVVEGAIATRRRGRRGFGYDSVFVPDQGEGRTFAEMSEQDKHAISHRGRALRALADRLALSF